MGLGNKGGENTPPPPAQQQDSGMDMEMLMGFMGMMEGMMGSQQQQQTPPPPTLPPMPEAPEVQRTPEVDWEEKQKQLASKSKAQNTLENSRKKGRSQTVHTSLLEEEPTTTSSILTSKT